MRATPAPPLTDRDITLCLFYVQVNSAKWMPCIFMYYCIKSKVYLFQINYLFIMASYESCCYELYIVDKYLFIAKIHFSFQQLLVLAYSTVWAFSRSRCCFLHFPSPETQSWAEQLLLGTIRLDF